jgi:hypothetical protein
MSKVEVYVFGVVHGVLLLLVILWITGVAK